MNGLSLSHVTHVGSYQSLAWTVATWRRGKAPSNHTIPPQWSTRVSSMFTHRRLLLFRLRRISGDCRDWCICADTIHLPFEHCARLATGAVALELNLSIPDGSDNGNEAALPRDVTLHHVWRVLFLQVNVPVRLSTPH